MDRSLTRAQSSDFSDRERRLARHISGKNKAVPDHVRLSEHHDENGTLQLQRKGCYSELNSVFQNSCPPGTLGCGLI